MQHRYGFVLILLIGSLAGPLAAAEPPQKKVLIIGIDGCRPDAMLAANAPNLHNLIKNGAFSDKAQTGDMTASGGGWGSLLTGVWREKHGVRGNDFKAANFGEFPDVLVRIKKAKPTSFVASIVHWEPIQKLIVTKADVTTSYKTDAEVAKAAAQLLSEKNPDLLFVHFDDVDGAGHANGFDPKQPKYLTAIEKTDERVGELLKAVKNRPTFAQEDWLFIVSTDHGGLGKGHGQNIPECRTIFVIVSGKAAALGRIEPAPEIVDIVPTALQHLGIAIDPQWKLDGKAVGLKNLASKEMPKGKTAAIKKVLLIGIDGCRPDAIPTAKEAVNLHALISEGAFSDQSDVLGDRVKGVPTITGPGWSSALTGVWADKHLVKDNLFRGENLAEYPNFMKRLRDVRPDAKAVALVTWKPFAEFIFAQADVRRFVLDGDVKGYEEGDRVVTKAAEKLLAEENPDAVFVYFGAVDITGHGYGFHPLSPKYTKSIEVVDEQIGRILAALKKRPQYAYEDWLIIVCTDHGGKGREHGFGEKEPQIRNGLLILNGPSVIKGKIEGKTENVDVAVTALTHLGVPIKPEWKLDGKAVGLKKTAP